MSVTFIIMVTPTSGRVITMKLLQKFIKSLDDCETHTDIVCESQHSLLVATLTRHLIETLAVSHAPTITRNYHKSTTLLQTSQWTMGSQESANSAATQSPSIHFLHFVILRHFDLKTITLVGYKGHTPYQV